MCKKLTILTILILLTFFLNSCSSCLNISNLWDDYDKEKDKNENKEVIYLTGTIEKSEIESAMSVFPEPTPFPPEFTNENIVIASLVMRSDIISRNDIITRSDFYKSLLLSDIFSEYFEIQNLDENWSYKISAPVEEEAFFILGYVNTEDTGNNTFLSNSESSVNSSITIIGNLCTETVTGETTSNNLFDESQSNQTFALENASFNSKTGCFETNISSATDSDGDGVNNEADEDSNGDGTNDVDEEGIITIDGKKYTTSFDLVANIEKTFQIKTTFDISDNAGVSNKPDFCSFAVNDDKRSATLTCKPTESDKIGKYDYVILSLSDTDYKIISLNLKIYTQQLFVGGSFICYLSDSKLNSGRVKCWGDNTYGQLGREDSNNIGDDASDNTTDDPTQLISNLPFIDLGTDGSGNPVSVKSLSTGTSHVCALLSDDSVKCWGANYFGQLGLGQTINDITLNIGDNVGEMGDSLSAINFGGSLKVKSLVTGSNHTCVIFSDNSVKCWGSGVSGALGQGNTNNIGNESDWFSTTSFLNLGSEIPTILGSGNQYTCALLESNGIRCWGNNSTGELGQGDVNDIGDNNELSSLSNLPITLDEGTDIISLSVGYEHACVLISDGSAKCWGNNAKGQLGQGNKDNIGNDPDEIKNLTSIDLGSRIVYGIYAGGNHTCAILDNGALKCWGSNGGAGVLGNSNTVDYGDNSGEMGNSLPEADLAKDDAIKSVAVGMNQGCVLFTDNKLKCWGLNDKGQLGLGDTTNRKITQLNDLAEDGIQVE